jgi:hypothetical protein
MTAPLGGLKMNILGVAIKNSTVLRGFISKDNNSIDKTIMTGAFMIILNALH